MPYVLKKYSRIMQGCASAIPVLSKVARHLSFNDVKTKLMHSFIVKLLRDESR